MKEDMKEYTKVSIKHDGSRSVIVIESDGKPTSELKANLRGISKRSARLIALTLAAPFCTKVYLQSDSDDGLIQLLARIHSNSMISLPMYRQLKSTYARLKPHLANLEVKTDDKKAYFSKGKVCFYE